jgi:hypothetical protein
MPTRTLPGVIVATAVLLGVGRQAQQSTTSMSQQVDVSRLGPQVGERVPDFSLRDQRGRRQTLQSIMGPKGAMLVFVRSADW